jgi:hypothetical protein
VHFPFDGDFQEYGSENFPFQVNGPELVAGMNGEPESAAYFNGLGTHINLNYDAPVITGSTFTIALWAKVLGPGGGALNNNLVFQQRDDDANGTTSKSTILFSVDNPDNNISFQIRKSESAGEYFYYPAAAYGEWHHYAVKYDNESNVTIYLDGIEVVKESYQGYGDFVTSVDHVDIGIHTYFLDQLKGALNALVSDFRIYSRPLDKFEINNLIHNSKK